KNHLRVLDAGAGSGVLTRALIEQLCNRKVRPASIDLTLYEIDSTLLPELEKTIFDCFELCRLNGIQFLARIFNTDFITSVVPLLKSDLWESNEQIQYDLAIVNPPYRQVRSDSNERLQLRSVGIETVNLYSGFVALIVRLLSRNGEIVAITPRSFSNGP